MQQRGGRRCSSRRCLSGTTRQHRRPRVSQAAAAVAGVPVDAVAAAAATVGAGVDDAAAQVAEQMVDAATQRKEVQGWIAACLSRFAAAARCPSHGGPRVSPPAIGKPNARPAGLCKIVWTCRRLLRCHFSSGGRVSWGCAPPQRARSRPPPQRTHTQLLLAPHAKTYLCARQVAGDLSHCDSQQSCCWHPLARAWAPTGKESLEWVTRAAQPIGHTALTQSRLPLTHSAQPFAQAAGQPSPGWRGTRGTATWPPRCGQR